ncbi:MAG: tetratricopeptide repeat protein [Treponema sp.]|jgi:tetratricopeptide (TPR) repeat protein|nr:tetratricopeptide repeat protein [Treponema sp.]
MPSLQQLNEFKTSFCNIGNELAVLAEQHSPYNDLPLPESEPASPSSFDVPAAGSVPTGTDDFPSALDLDSLGDFPSEDFAPSDDFGGSSPADETPGPDSIDDFDFDDLLNTLPEDLPPALEPESAPERPAPEETAPEVQVPGESGGDFAHPEDASSGLAEDSGKGEKEEPSKDSFMENSSPDEFSSQDFSPGDFAAEDSSSTGPASDGLPSEEFASDDFAAEDFSADMDFGDSALSADAASGGEEGGNTDAFEADDFFDGDFQTPPPDLDAGTGDQLPEVKAGSGDFSPSNLNLSQDDEFSPPKGKTEEAAGTDEKAAFDRFNLGDGAAGVKTEADGHGTGGSLSDLDDFSLPGIDDIFDTSGKSLAAAPKKLEDIVLSEEDMARLQETLARYPLNLRVACEEIIVDRGAAVEQMDALIKLIVRGGTPKEAAALAGKILDKSIPIPKGFEKKTGEALEIEQRTFSYVFFRKFLPILRIFLLAALTAASLSYLAWQFIYIPIHSESIYRRGYERIAAGEYERANERFSEAFSLRRVKKWFYRYAEAFRDERQYLYAEEKYDELLRYYPRDQKGALDYANLETYYLRNYSKADRIIRTNILDYRMDDQEGLMALGDNNLAWGEVDPARYENARQAYARLLERYGWRDPIVERMLLYFIRTDNLGEVIPLRQILAGDSRKKVSPAVLSELGGYLLNKQLEEVRGVPDANVARIEGVKDILIRAGQGDPALPEPRYHLARYYNHFGSIDEEREALESALTAFDAAREESPRRTAYRIDAERRFAQVLANAREFFSAEERLIKGIGIYEDALNRRLLTRSPEYGRLYADLGDIEYFTKSRDMDRALEYYRQAELSGWAPPEIQYRMGAAHYHLRQWENALDRFFTASAELPLNRRLLHALGNVSYLRGNYFAAQGYYRRLLDILEAERSRFPMLSPNERPDHMELAERLMVARNNMAVALEALTDRTSEQRYRTEAMAFYAESARAWDALTRDPNTMIRSTSVNLGFLNSRNILHPQTGYEPQLFNQIDKDVLEPSSWEALSPPDYRLSD